MRIITLILMLVFLIGCTTTPNDNIGSTNEPNCKTEIIKEKVTEQESYQVVVQYNKKKTYYVDEGRGTPHCKYSVLKFEATPKPGFENIDGEAKYVCNIDVTNQDDVPGNFTLSAKFVTTIAGGGPESEPQTLEINPGKTISFKFILDEMPQITNGCSNVNVELPQKKECEYSYYEKVMKTRLVPAERNETRYRNITVEKVIEEKEICE